MNPTNKKPIYIFLHMPKTGGQSIENHIRRNLPEEQVFTMYMGKGIIFGDKKESFERLKKLTDKEKDKIKIIFANTDISIAITSITNMNVGGVIGSNIGAGDPAKINQFFNENCDTKKSIIELAKEMIEFEYNEKLIQPKKIDHNIILFSENKLTCDFLIEVRQNPYIYELADQ